MSSMQKTNDALQRNLNASIERLNEHRKLAEKIRDNFARAGINAQVDTKTGDVTLNFGQEYFETDQAALKPGMRSTLQQTFPIYAKSLFEDPKITKRLGSVEIIGFASPTYGGKFVDPSSIAAQDRAAVNYNMDLSYRRAKSIFEFVFNADRMNFQHQKALLPLVKVSGRSYLANDKDLQRNLAGAAPGNDYCQRYDCKKSQIVLIKFNLKEE